MDSKQYISKLESTITSVSSGHKSKSHGSHKLFNFKVPHQSTVSTTQNNRMAMCQEHDEKSDLCLLREIEVCHLSPNCHCRRRYAWLFWVLSLKIINVAQKHGVNPQENSDRIAFLSQT